MVFSLESGLIYLCFSLNNLSFFIKLNKYKKLIVNKILGTYYI